MLVFDHKLIVNTPTWCHTALESTFNAIFTVDMAVMSLCLDFQSTLLQDLQRERLLQLPVPDLTTLSLSPPGEHISILPCMLCGTVPVSLAGIRGRRPKKLDPCAIQTGLRQVKHYQSLLWMTPTLSARLQLAHHSQLFLGQQLQKVCVIEQSQSTNR